ncbi:MAG: hypothetical protein U1F35_02570 [Steroidobacteraceae bacterium]
MRLPTLPAMKLLGVYFERNRHWTLLLLPVMLIAFLAGLFLLATEGQARLELANVRVQQSDQREQLLAAYMNERRECGNRAAWLPHHLRNENDLLPYRKAVARIGFSTRSALPTGRTLPPWSRSASCGSPPA